MNPPDPNGMEAQPAVRTVDLFKNYGRGESRVAALKGVNFEARCGELLMIVGPSGCGKTTLLSAVCGTLRFDSGSVFIFGRDLSKMAPSEITEFRGRHVGFIFQQFNLISSWTALENVTVPLLLNGATQSEADKTAADILADVGLGDKLRMRPSQLSGGQQQRVAIARALVHNPKLIICDEPTAALDAASGRKVLQLLKERACHPERCVIVVTHDSRIFSFADRIAEMEDGQIKAVHGSDYCQSTYV